MRIGLSNAVSVDVSEVWEACSESGQIQSLRVEFIINKENMKKSIYLFLLGAAVSTSLYAQKGVEDGSQYGHGEDSIRCIQNVSLYRTYAKQKDYASALEFWEIAYNECPAATVNLYIDGVNIRRWQMQQEKDPAKKMEYFKLLLQVFDQRVQYFGNYVRAPKPSIMGLKGVEFFQSHPDLEHADKSEAYQWLKQCIEETSVDQFNAAIAPFFVMASKAMLSDPAHEEQFYADYLKVNQLLDDKIEATPDSVQQAKIRGYKSSTDDLFVKSGVADCESLEKLFSAQLPNNLENLDWLKKVISIYKRVRCTEMPTYFAAAEAAHKLEPTAESAEGCAYMFIKKGDYVQAAKYLTEAIDMESSKDKKADYEYLAASTLFAGKRFSEARQHALNAASLRLGYGDPYILIAKMYANSVDQFDDPVLRRAVYWAATDKMERAKSVDPSKTNEANEFISRYREQYPNSEDVFMHPALDEGKTYRVGGWINENTTVRSKK